MVIVGFGISGCGATVAPGPDQNYYRQSQQRRFWRGGQTNPATLVPPGTYTVLRHRNGNHQHHPRPYPAGQVLVGTTN